MIPEEISRGYSAASQRAAWIGRADRGLIVVSGADRRSYLQGLLTNDVASLAAGTGCYAAYLTPQGRMITDLWVYELGDVVLISVGAKQKDGLLTKLDQFIFSEDVQLGDATDTFASVVVVGPEAAAAVAAALESVTATALSSLGNHGNARATFRGDAAIVLRVVDLGAPGFEVLVQSAQLTALREALTRQSVEELDDTSSEAIRIEAGIPKFGIDMDDDTIPLEAGIEAAAISLTKGCYVGQEVIIRILHRGHGRVARKLIGLTFDGTRTAVERSPVVSEGKEIGEVRSTTLSPLTGRAIALAYLHRDFLTPGMRVQAEGLNATVTALPFVPPQ